jgi:acyl carrier protein
MLIDKECIIKVISDTINVDIVKFSEIKIDEDLRDWGLDSLKSIDVIVSLEKEFEIAIEDEDLLMENFNTVEKMIKLVNKYTNAKEVQ